MAAFIVVTSSSAPSVPCSGTRLNIFPGSAAPSVFAAGKPFWIGYGFAPEAEGDEATVHPDTRFELLVDGEAAPLYTDLKIDEGRTTRKFTVAHFPDGLPAGWHAFAGRWYDEGVLELTSDRSIEFVER